MDIKVNKILVISIQGTGDLLLTTPLLHRLKRIFPQAKLSILTYKSREQILSNNPDVDEIIIFDPRYQRNIFKTLAFLFKLRQKYFDLSICAYPSGLRSGFISYLTGANLRAGQDFRMFKKYPWLFNVKAEIEEIKHAVEMNLDLLRALGVDTEDIAKEPILNLSRDDREFASKFLKDNGVSSSDTVIAIHAGVSKYNMKYKSWPKERFAKVADILIGQFQKKVLFIGGKDEVNLVNEIAGLMKNKALNVVGKYDLMQAAALIQRCNLLICNNSGPMHIAAALKIPTVSIPGPVDSRIHGPWGGNHIVLQSKLDCAPCYYPFYRDTLEETKLRNRWIGKKFICKTGDYRCFTSISVEDVLEAAKTILKIKI